MFYTVDSVHLPSIRHLNFYIGGKMKINQEVYKNENMD